MASRKKPPGFELPPSSRKVAAPQGASGDMSAQAHATVLGDASAEGAVPQPPQASQKQVGWIYRSDRPQTAAPPTESPAAMHAAPPVHWLERVVMQTLGSSYLLLLMPLSWKPLRRLSKLNPKE